MHGIPLDNGVESPGGRSTAMLDVGTGTLETTGTVVGVVFALFLVRAWGVAPYATLLALGHGLSAPSLLALRLLSDLLLVGLFALAICRWVRGPRARGGRAPGRIVRWQARLSQAVTSGSVFLNALTAGYFVNSYVVFALVPTLPRGRRRALAGTLAGELGGYALDLLAILGLSSLIGGSPALLMAGIAVVALVLTLANHQLQRRFRPDVRTASAAA
jgi:hypothetical protein